MNHGWQKKKLGDIGTIITGSTPNTTVESYYDSDDFMFVKPGDIDDNSLNELSISETYISAKAYNEVARKLPKGTILVTCIGIIGKVAILCEEATCNQQINAIVPNDTINNKFLGYVIMSIRDLLVSKKNGPVVPIINKSQFSNFQIPVPPIEVQERIVRELNKLNELIEIKRKQLKDLDTLAQSLFYEIFGDPNSNPNYEFKSFESISINLDSKRRPVTKSKRLSGIYPYYGASGIVDYVDDYIFEGEYLLISEDGANLVSRTQPIAFIAKGKTWINNHAHVIDFHNSASKIYVMFYMNILDFREKVTGAAQPKLTQKALNEIPISWPPIELQDEFASKIEAIEKQKRLIESSIADLETLLASRMDYWFNE